MKQKRPFATKFHRDGTVTIWCVEHKCWIRGSSFSDNVLATLPESERTRVLQHIGSK
jgi:hypothetical protein